MRYMTRCVLTVAVLLILGGTASSRAFGAVSFEFFYSNLSPHGSWEVSAQYGQVWHPAVETSDWDPYLDGHWVYTDLGWTWVSDYSWGAIPYHYGTWVFDPGLGWVWVPGYTWAPAWVVFRTGPEYIGWAPVPPGYFVDAAFEAPATSSFIFVTAQNFTAPRIRAHTIPGSARGEALRHTSLKNTISLDNGFVVNRGVDIRAAERAKGARIRTVRIERLPRVGLPQGAGREQLRVPPGPLKSGIRAAEPRRGEGPPHERHDNGAHEGQGSKGNGKAHGKHGNGHGREGR